MGQGTQPQPQPRSQSRSARTGWRRRQSTGPPAAGLMRHRSMYALIRGKGRHIHTHTLYIPWRGSRPCPVSVQWKDDDCRVRSTSPEAPGRDYRVVRQRQSKARSGAGNFYRSRAATATRTQSPPRVEETASPVHRGMQSECSDGLGRRRRSVPHPHHAVQCRTHADTAL